MTKEHKIWSGRIGIKNTATSGLPPVKGRKDVRYL